MYKITFYVPQNHAESVKQAMFDAGAGKWGNYDQVAWQVLGEGQFRPLAGSSPAIGEQDELTILPEYKVEMLCQDEVIKEAISALISAHPYEEPAYDWIKLEN